MATILDSVLAGRDLPASTLPILWNHIGRRQVAILPVLGERTLGASESERLQAARCLAGSLFAAQLHHYWVEARWRNGHESPLVFISAPAGRDLFALSIARLIQEYDLSAALLFHPAVTTAEFFSRARNEWLPLAPVQCGELAAVWAELDPTGGWSGARRRRLEIGKAWLWRECRQDEPRAGFGSLALSKNLALETLVGSSATS